MPSYCEQPPAAWLTRWVECVWRLQSDSAVSGHRVPPDGCLDIVFDRQHGLRAIGTMTQEQRFDFPEGVCMAGIRFRPGMAGTFLGVSPAELTDGAAPLEDLWDRRAHEFKVKLEEARSIQDAMPILLSSLPMPDPAPNPVQKAIEAIAAANGNADLDSVARQANLSPRQFRRRCLEESGLGPKHLCRVLRFRHACRIARAVGQLNMGQRNMDRLNWSAIALEAEYFDQAHFIRDFRRFTGLTPMAVFSNTRQPGSSSIEA
ncbi:MAG TPA: helix-turn-helix domain-containing protein [Candidatus Eremiobacteraceae bacterium]|nr:helix-turn-helix domain-containing protein [Candidatus Eremiobacteraceae bacterium]